MWQSQRDEQGLLEEQGADWFGYGEDLSIFGAGSVGAPRGEAVVNDADVRGSAPGR